MTYYTGVGSTKTPLSVRTNMYHLAMDLAALEITLRSGGADGADSAFEDGCIASDGPKEIYLPWAGFNGRSGEDYFHLIPSRAFEIATTIHPAWFKLSFGSKRLHARNIQQVLGRDPANPLPSKFLICWTEHGEDVGGTRTAIVLARKFNVPVYNLGHWEYENIPVEEFLKLLKKDGHV